MLFSIDAELIVGLLDLVSEGRTRVLQFWVLAPAAAAIFEPANVGELESCIVGIRPPTPPISSLLLLYYC